MKKRSNHPFKYYAIATQASLTIFCAVFLGSKLDQFLKTENYYITLLIASGSIFYVFYSIVNRIKKEK